MSSMSYLLGRAATLTIAGTYVAHGDGRTYAFTAFWHAEGALVRWHAAVTNERAEHIASPNGTIELSRLADPDAEKWVRAALELSVERMTSASRSAAGSG